MIYQTKTTSLDISTILNTVAVKVGIITKNEHITLHCFRRGSAQYRFFYSTPKWPLNAVKAWGGWAASEGIFYLYNRFNKYLI